MQSRKTERVGQVRIRSLIEKHPHDLDVPRSRGGVQCVIALIIGSRRLVDWRPLLQKP
jgi:hypothetical protein